MLDALAVTLLTVTPAPDDDVDDVIPPHLETLNQGQLLEELKRLDRSRPGR